MSTKEIEWDGLPIPKRYGAILAIAMGITVSVLDGTIANVERLPVGYRGFLVVVVFFGGYIGLSAGVYRRFVYI